VVFQEARRPSIPLEVRRTNSFEKKENSLPASETARGGAGLWQGVDRGKGEGGGKSESEGPVGGKASSEASRNRFRQEDLVGIAGGGKSTGQGVRQGSRKCH